MLSGAGVLSATGVSAGDAGAAESDGLGVEVVAWAGVRPPSKSTAETSTASSRTDLPCSLRMRRSPRVCTREIRLISPRYRKNFNL